MTRAPQPARSAPRPPTTSIRRVVGPFLFALPSFRKWWRLAFSPGSVHFSHLKASVCNPPTYTLNIRTFEIRTCSGVTPDFPDSYFTDRVHYEVGGTPSKGPASTTYGVETRPVDKAHRQPIQSPPVEQVADHSDTRN